MKIVVIGAGYVGFSSAVLLSTRHEVTVLDVNPKIARCIQEKISPFEDTLISEYLAERELNLSFSGELYQALINADYCVLALPTNFDDSIGFFDTDLLDSYIQKITALNPGLVIVIKSTVPFGFTESMKIKHGNGNIIFVPEFLREGSALKDNLYPSRLIIGGESTQASNFESIIAGVTAGQDYETVHTSATEAEAIKLFSNTFLAARVSFFNELDSFAIQENLSAVKLIKGVCLDPRVGNFYNNPSFGYGGYCLPKDTKQTAALLDSSRSPLIQSITESNVTRKRVIAEDIISTGAKNIGIYRLVMKAGSDNFRETALSEIIEVLVKRGQNIIIYEPLFLEKAYETLPVVSNFKEFIDMCDLVVANRVDDLLVGYEDKVYSRDIYSVD
jgi:UDPglucose 6-dehydrogenase